MSSSIIRITSDVTAFPSCAASREARLLVNAERNIVFIAGMGRSGSTLLGELLGQIEGWAAVGEVRYFWDRGVQLNSQCACRTPLAECEVWGDLVRGYAERPAADVEGMVAVRDALRSRDCWRAVFGAGRSVLEERAARYAEQLQALYSEIPDAVPARTFVDSSKFPSHGYALDRLEGYRPYVLHLVRDPRAVAYSWQKKKVYEKKGDEVIYIRRLGVVRSTLHWLSWNLLIERLWDGGPRGRPYRRVRYEDFVRSPEQTLERIARWVDPEAALPFVDRDRVELRGGHALSGNPSRFKTGEIVIQEDADWKRIMPRTQIATVTAMAWPLMFRYGYSLGTSGGEIR